MTTLAVMKARIASEIRRPNTGTMADHIASAINTAITELEAKRFYFNESRDFTFATVAEQEFYDGDDSAFIPRMLKFDYVHLIIGTSIYVLDPENAGRLDWLSQSGTQTGQPLVYGYFGEQIRLYPVPAIEYTVRIAGQVKMPAPASDVEADNPWMTKAEKLVRCWAKWEIYEHVTMEPEKADRFNPENDAGPTGLALRELKSRTNNLLQQGGWEIHSSGF